jgi:hypothetical protein
MPRHCEWIQRLPQALDELRSLPCPTIDRRTVERLFDVSPRQALRILSFLGSYSAGASLQIERRELITRLERLNAEDGVQMEQRRHERVRDHLESLRREQAARRRKIPVSAEAVETRISSLPPGVRLYPGTLEIRFETPEELLSKLFSLAQAIANDYSSFEQAIG